MEQILEERKVLNAGMVSLVEIHGSDEMIARTARTSYRNNLKDTAEKNDANTIDYLVRHRHTTPIEFAGATFYMVMPIFVARQLIRHRTMSINEESLRYIEAREEFWIPSPEECKRQSTDNKQGSSSEFVDFPEMSLAIISDSGNHAHQQYKKLLKEGLSNELARSVLPLGQYTAWYLQTDLWNLMHLLYLRTGKHVQYQTKVYAEAMIEMLMPHFPLAMAAFENHILNAVTFSGDEWNIINEWIKDVSSSENSIHNINQWVDLGCHVDYNMNRFRPTRIKELLDKLGD